MDLPKSASRFPDLRVPEDLDPVLWAVGGQPLAESGVSIRDLEKVDIPDPDPLFIYDLYVHKSAIESRVP